MGIRNVNAAFVYWTHLPDRPFRLLVRMCATANDDTEHYYAGQESMAEGLGLVVPKLPDDTADPTYQAIRQERAVAFRRVRRALQTLTDAGVVTVKKRARTGRRAEYLVHPTTRPEEVTQRPTEAVTQRPTEKLSTTPPEQTIGCPPVGHSVTYPVGHQMSPSRSLSDLPSRSLSDPPTNTDHSLPEQDHKHSSPKVTQESAPAGAANDIDQVRAKRVIRSYVDHGGDLPTLQGDAPDGLSKTDREIWVARAILATKETA